MAKQRQEVISVQGTVVNIVKHNKDDYISLTDLARQKNPRDPKDVVKNWLRTQGTIK